MVLLSSSSRSSFPLLLSIFSLILSSFVQNSGATRLKESPRLLEEIENELKVEDPMGEGSGEGEAEEKVSGLVNVIVGDELDSNSRSLEAEAVIEGSGEEETSVNTEKKIEVAESQSKFPEFVKAIDKSASKIGKEDATNTIQECSPSPCCELDINVPPFAWRLPQQFDPRDVIAIPRGSNNFPHQTSLIVNLENCFPLAVRHKSGCAEIAYGGMHLIRCIHGSFRHVFFPKTEIIGVSCGHCDA